MQFLAKETPQLSYELLNAIQNASTVGSKYEAVRFYRLWFVPKENSLPLIEL